VAGEDLGGDVGPIALSLHDGGTGRLGDVAGSALDTLSPHRTIAVGHRRVGLDGLGSVGLPDRGVPTGVVDAAILQYVNGPDPRPARREAEIADLARAVGGKEDVGGLEVEVEDAGGVNMGEASAELAEDLDDAALVESVVRTTVGVEELGEGAAVAELGLDVEVAALLPGGLEGDDVAVVAEGAQGVDFLEAAGAILGSAKGELGALDGPDGARLALAHGKGFARLALAEVVVDDELGFEAVGRAEVVASQLVEEAGRVAARTERGTSVGRMRRAERRSDGRLGQGQGGACRGGAWRRREPRRAARIIGGRRRADELTACRSDEYR
jgi:hypothetical protein